MAELSRIEEQLAAHLAELERHCRDLVLASIELGAVSVSDVRRSFARQATIPGAVGDPARRMLAMCDMIEMGREDERKN